MHTRASQPSMAGFAGAAAAYLIWGLTPILFKALEEVPTFEILMHRIIWSFLLLLPILSGYRRWRKVAEALTDKHTLGILLSSTAMVTCNWFVFIWAISHSQILQTSLGYFISPMVNVLLGMIFLKERLRILQIVAVVLACSAMLYLTAAYGELPWIALALAFSFGLYGFIRKVAPVGSLEGLAVETLLLFLPAVLYLFYLDRRGTGALFQIGLRIDLLLMGTALVTAVPLLLFIFGTRRLQLTTMGFLQYITPSCSFLLAVFIYNEPFQAVQLRTFMMVWLALIIFSSDAWRHYRHIRP